MLGSKKAPGIFQCQGLSSILSGSRLNTPSRAMPCTIGRGRKWNVFRSEFLPNGQSPHLPACLSPNVKVLAGFHYIHPKMPPLSQYHLPHPVRCYCYTYLASCMYMSLFSAFFRFHVSINRLYIIKLFETLYHLVDGFALLGSHILHIVRDIGKLTADIFKTALFQMFLDSCIAFGSP